MLVAVLAPKYMAGMALTELRTAVALTRYLHLRGFESWTVGQSFFVGMGGCMVVCKDRYRPLEADTLISLLSLGLIRIAEPDDKSNGGSVGGSILAAIGVSPKAEGSTQCAAPKTSSSSPGSHPKTSTTAAKPTPWLTLPLISLHAFFITISPLTEARTSTPRSADMCTATWALALRPLRQSADAAAGVPLFPPRLPAGERARGEGGVVAADGSDFGADVFVYDDQGVFACGGVCGIEFGADVAVCDG